MKGGVQKQQQPPRQQLEAALIELSDGLHEGALDLNVDESMVETQFAQLKDTRRALLASYGVPQQPKKTVNAPKQQAGGNNKQMAIFTQQQQRNGMIPAAV